MFYDPSNFNQQPRFRDAGGTPRMPGGIVPPHMRQAGGLPPVPQMHTGGPGQMFPMNPNMGLMRPPGQPPQQFGQVPGGMPRQLPQGWNALARMYFGGGR